MITLTFKYENHRGEVAERTVDAESLDYLPSPGFGYAPGWFICGRCHAKDARRSFALQSIVLEDRRRVCRLLTF